MNIEYLSNYLSKYKINTGKMPKGFLILNILVSLFYLTWWLNFSNMGNPVLYGLLLFGEIYHVFSAITFWYTIWPHKKREKLNIDSNFSPSVDIYITVAGEPVDVVRETALAAKNIHYANKKVYILNDGFVAKKDNWQDIIALGEEIGVHVITRKIPGGAKAGNINNALRKTKGDLVLIFDADMVAEPEFLQKTVYYFQDPKMGFVQTPQYYINQNENVITQASWQQQEFFFGPIMRGKDSYNSAFICGTNVVIRRKALLEAGGMFEENIAEDFLTSLLVHQKGWKSVYVPDVLATGFAPFDLLAYFKQQLRWARGSLEVLFGFNPLFRRGLTWSQKLQYLSSALFYLNGLVVLIDIAIPIIVLFTGIVPVTATTTSFAFYFVPFLFLNLYTLYHVSRGQYSFKAAAFGQSSFYLQLLALKAVLLKEKTAFAVTPKQAQSGTFPFLAYPHIAYIVLTALAVGVAVGREGFSPSVAANVSWCAFNILLFMPFIATAFGNTALEEELKVTHSHANA
jgi:cellulose synthase (UDP-forming)